MPFFDYVCKACETTEEFLLQRSELDKEILCPKCNAVMSRLIGNTDFKMAGAPPKNWQPMSKNQPKSQVRNIHEIRRVEETK